MHCPGRSVGSVESAVDEGTYTLGKGVDVRKGRIGRFDGRSVAAPQLGPGGLSMGAHHDLSYGEEPQVAEELTCPIRGAAAVDGAADDRVDEPECLSVRSSDAALAVHRQHFGGPRQSPECLTQRDGRDDDPLPGILGKFRLGKATRRIVDELDQEVVPVTYVVVEGRRSDIELLG